MKFLIGVIGLLLTYNLQAKTTLTVMNNTGYKVCGTVLIGSTSYKNTGTFGFTERHSGSDSHQFCANPHSRAWQHVSKKKKKNIKLVDLHATISGPTDPIIISTKETEEVIGKQKLRMKTVIMSSGILGRKWDDKNWSIEYANPNVTKVTKELIPEPASVKSDNKKTNKRTKGKKTP